jgi:hypothetical protein
MTEVFLSRAEDPFKAVLLPFVTPENTSLDPLDIPKGAPLWGSRMSLPPIVTFPLRRFALGSAIR